MPGCVTGFEWENKTFLHGLLGSLSGTEICQNTSFLLTGENHILTDHDEDDNNDMESKLHTVASALEWAGVLLHFVILANNPGMTEIVTSL